MRKGCVGRLRGGEGQPRDARQAVAPTPSPVARPRRVTERRGSSIMVLVESPRAGSGSGADLAEIRRSSRNAVSVSTRVGRSNERDCLLRSSHALSAHVRTTYANGAGNDHTQIPTRPRRRSLIATVTVFDPTGLVAAALFARASFGDIMGRIEAVEGSPRQPQPARGAHLGAKP